jgi:hypothetical protein
MARVGRRTYNRDARGRFASGGSGGKVKRGAPKAAGGSLKARASAAKSRKKLAEMDPGDRSLKAVLSRRAQKAAVTRTAKAAVEARKANRVRLKLKEKPKTVLKKNQRRNANKTKITKSKPSYQERLLRARQTARRIEASRAERASRPGATYRDYVAKLTATRRRNALLSRPLPPGNTGQAARSRTSRKKTKTDRQVSDQIQRILNSSLDRNRVIGEKTMEALKRASDRVVGPSEARILRAMAVRDRLERSGAKNNLLSGPKNRDQGSRLADRILELRRISENTPGRWGIENVGQMILSARREAYYKTKKGRAELKRLEAAKRAAEDAASRAALRRMGLL